MFFRNALLIKYLILNFKSLNQNKTKFATYLKLFSKIIVPDTIYVPKISQTNIIQNSYKSQKIYVFLIHFYMLVKLYIVKNIFCFRIKILSFINCKMIFLRNLFIIYNG